METYHADSPPRNRAWFVAALGVAALLALTACVQPFEPSCIPKAVNPEGKYKYTEDQALVGCDYAHLLANPELTVLNKKTGLWEVRPEGVSIERLYKLLGDQEKDLDYFLSYANKNFAEHLDSYRGLRGGLLRQEMVTREILRRLSIAKVFGEFVEKVGTPSVDKDDKAKEALEYFFPHGMRTYSPRIFYPGNGAGKSLGNLPFSASYLEAAKQNGTLKLVDSIRRESSAVYAKKITDRDDPNKFSWKNTDRGWEILGYKIVHSGEEPRDNEVNYVEVFRVIRGKKEALPAVRGFMPSAGTRVQVFLIDYEREGEIGHGSPDEVWQTGLNDVTVEKMESDANLRSRLLDALYTPPNGARIDRERSERKSPAKPPIYLVVKRLGEVPIQLWEKGEWKVPYAYDSLNPSLKFVFEKRLQADDTAKILKGKAKRVQQISLIVREYTRSGDKVAVEYWSPKKEYAARDVLEANVSGDTVSVVRVGKPKETQYLDYFVEKVKMVDYFFGGRWFRVMDEDGNGTFEKRREIAEPTLGDTAASFAPTASEISPSPSSGHEYGP